MAPSLSPAWGRWGAAREACLAFAGTVASGAWIVVAGACACGASAGAAALPDIVPARPVVEIIAHQDLRDLHGVERGALAQIVRDHPEAKPVRHRGIPADPAHEDGVLARRVLRRHIDRKSVV